MEMDTGYPALIEEDRADENALPRPSKGPTLLAVGGDNQNLLQFLAKSGSGSPSPGSGQRNARSKRLQNPSPPSRMSLETAFHSQRSGERTGLDARRQTCHSVNFVRIESPKQTESLMPTRKHHQQGDPAGLGQSDL